MKKKPLSSDDIHTKFGDDYAADENTFTMGIDIRFTSHFADRFKGQTVLETCTGAGFTTLSLARAADQVITVEIDPLHQAQAVSNLRKAGLSSKVSFLLGDILDEQLLENLPPVDAAFLDPDWAVTGPDHIFRFLNSNTKPPADLLLNRMFDITENIALVLPPLVDPKEFGGLRKHEREELYMGKNHALFCLYFGELLQVVGVTRFTIPD